MEVGDLVKILDESRSPSDCRKMGTVIVIGNSPGSHIYDYARVLWQNGVYGKIETWRLEIVNEAR